MRAFIILAVVAAANAGILAPGATQYHAQDELGQYSYGYAGGPSSKAESKTADGVVRGAYSYIDGHGLVQSVNYVADPVNGFRVAATNLPVGPAPVAPVAVGHVAVGHAAVAAPVLAQRSILAPAQVLIGAPQYHAHAAPLNNGAVHIANLPLPPVDTPEVQIARAQHLAAKLG